MNKINYISLIICAVLIHLSAVAQLRYTPEIEAQASQGDKDALRSLGYCYQSGNGLKISYTNALSNYNKAAEKGSVTAHNDIGWCLLHGYGAAADTVKALKAFQAAAKQGDPYGMINLAFCV